eukprot:CAMPEP_0198142670 /NCGR_PEP_ID=MMETSP1443-20131203/5402_1 /TAXON_ID=186043 /ORGANISM="Entomoneis sp., Strain CCMP2396" /LENGTH=196 /DNA_ID=CAMNT_0043805739 /DNA_START=46 /DNA_END=636 /DNA_ORIENTATION=+
MAPNDYDDFDDEEEEEEEEVAEIAPPKKRTKKWKDPNKPKRAMSSFFLYSQGNRTRVKEENPEASFGEVARILAHQFKALNEKDKKKWDKKNEIDKARYQEEMKDYVPMEDPTGGGRKKQKKDPNAPKRNMSAYFLYSVFIRPTVKEENPEAGFGDIARIISAQFKALSARERKTWDEKAVEDKERYQRQMADYQG